MKIAVASPPFPQSIDDGLHNLELLVKDAAEQGSEIVCFPESYLPGYRALEFVVPVYPQVELQAALTKTCAIAQQNNIAIILPMDWYEGDRFLNVAHVISKTGEPLGYQAKNQLDPSEDEVWAAGEGRYVYEIGGVKFGIVICHEGFRYPELTRWAARQGAQIVFHPHCAGSNTTGTLPTQWGSMDNPYYEKAMMMRALENTIYFASSNYSFTYPESASSIIAPDGKLLSYQPYGETGVTVVDIDLGLATGYLAQRFKPGLLG